MRGNLKKRGEKGCRLGYLADMKGKREVRWEENLLRIAENRGWEIFVLE